ncbi:recombinase family protein [Aureimonas psammosilenae]|uniref:recombinase family protein n=1 Tax=Aureimonas psammosilenae TaxID=2495496 RepID=UPI00126047D4|nr:recombinase family protein [Aureimonas psammosilenae]
MSHTRPAAAHRFVSYLRVSTAKQGSDGLGIDAQRSAVEAYVQRMAGANATVLHEYLEVESGRRDDRQQLRAAIEHAQLSGARLVIAKLDRLSRDVHFLSGLQKAGVDFVAADMPDANALTVHILAAVAQHEREMISARTKAALVEAKRRGVKLGNPNGAEGIRHLGTGRAVAAITAKADAKAKQLQKALARIEADGITTALGTANALNERGILSPRGGAWTATAVQRLRKRLAVGEVSL